MLQFFRNFFKSKLGVPVMLAFLVLIGLAFASADVANTGTFGGVSGGDRVAVVGDQRISTADLAAAMTAALDNEKQQNPTLTMQAFIAQGGMDRVLNELLQRTAISEYARKHGLRAGDRLIDSELVQIPAFRGADGKFDNEAFQAVLRQRGLSEALVRQDIAAGLFARQVLLPATFGTAVPESLAQRYARLLRERRQGSIAVLPSTAFAPEGAPTAEQLQAYYRENNSDYIRPERRVISYATFGEEVLGDTPAPTDAQIAARYEQNREQYAASESRTFTQLVVPTQAAAKAVADRVAAGTSLAAAASASGLATTTVGPVTKAAFAAQTSQAVADAAFAAGQGAVAAPARGGLGWYVLRVDQIDRKPARSLADVRGEIAESLAAELRRTAFLDIAARIEEQLEEGGSLAEVADELNLELQTTRPLTADGRVYGTDETAPPVLAPALRTAFDMEEEEPQLAEVEPGKTFLVFGVTDITPSAPAPLAQIREDVIADWRRSVGSERAKAAAQRVLQRVQKGQALAAALAAEKVQLPPIDPVNMGREELAQAQQVPPVLALLFSMAKGTVKRLEAPQDNGWFVVQLDQVTVPEMERQDPLVGATRQQLAGVFGEEYAEQLVKAAQREVGVERNQEAIDAVARQLTGQTE
ncbi:peptidylprolyl isomerase [Altererythrobacter soli]|uniref:Parvulin-like PPIase n=1 Tax=Croceibacterium soli TaxID=1739690 RepID=A0A6I4UUX8_9SPHN|nr:peptidylprolyl isomerase [Croceibacterium soli]MXP42346.1 peptidylprolyl isomerase [Croceibacterium soli]